MNADFMMLIFVNADFMMWIFVNADLMIDISEVCSLFLFIIIFLYEFFVYEKLGTFYIAEICCSVLFSFVYSFCCTRGSALHQSLLGLVPSVRGNPNIEFDFIMSKK